jgi:sterol desaturase/sphingolipid hydroxylase (fatty acid hydroxylase superfamily)
MYKNPQGRKVADDVMRDTHQGFQGHIENTFEAELAEKKEPDSPPAKIEPQQLSFWSLVSGIAAIPLALIVGFIIWLIVVEVLYWFFPMPHTWRQGLAIPIAIVLTGFFFATVNKLRGR